MKAPIKTKSGNFTTSKTGWVLSDNWELKKGFVSKQQLRDRIAAWERRYKVEEVEFKENALENYHLRKSLKRAEIALYATLATLFLIVVMEFAL